MKTNQVFVSLLACAAVAFAANLIRSKRAAYELPAGVEFFIPGIRTTFACPDEGIFADIDNACQLFHMCRIVDGQFEQHTFACGNKTLFNQFSMTCDFEENVNCGSSQELFYLARLIGQDKEFLHTSADVDRAYQLGFGNRLRK
ncbi:cuticular protein-like protein [Leptotrombidium deliense]|uniref:Cuticular protein-like protein n=1 Tax=Leptotrombidium deliense TaxID=299467 RepID=A0A443SQ71_9ACAR|nr:cuticular protein-like protein [Leptotrombidium deliense]